MTCKNPECGKHIEKRKSAKRCYCNDRCKNRAAYIRRKENWYEVDAHNKVLKTNYSILLKLKNFNLGPISIQTLQSHGFEFTATHKDVVANYNGQTETVSRLYDIHYVIENKHLIFKD